MRALQSITRETLLPMCYDIGPETSLSLTSQQSIPSERNVHNLSCEPGSH